MKTLAIIQTLLLVFLVTGCHDEPSELKLAASKLKAEMNKNEVKRIFANCPLVATNIDVEIKWETKLYSTNRTSASDLIFREPSYTSHFCVVYFDTNDVIMAYKLEGLFDDWGK